MKLKISILFAVVALFACNNNNKEVQQLKEKNKQDSINLAKAQGKDSIITSYVNTMAEIQDNLDSLKAKEKILTMQTAEGKRGDRKSMIEDIKAIDNAIIENNKKIIQLETKLRKMENKDASLKKMIAHLNKEIAKKDSEISYYQNKLTKSDDSIVALTHRFNDSITVIHRQRAQYNELQTAYNTVYYTTGTMKQLKDKGIINKTGGLLGIGRTAELKGGASNSAFTQGDMTQLHSLPLNGKFVKVITTHPANSYKITGKTKNDSLVITSPNTFWSESRYLVVQVR